MQIMDVTAMSVGSDSGDLLSLEERFSNELGKLYVQSGQESTAILEASNKPETASSPEALIDLQRAIHDHSLTSTIYSLLAKHTVDTVSTLLKS
jgi:hypothetical protein